MPLQHGEMFAAIQANHVIGEDRTLHRHSGFCLWWRSSCLFGGSQRVEDLLDKP
jgi:hypothetical protein